MKDEPIKVLRAARDTRTQLRFENGVPENTVLDMGAGKVLGNDYTSQDDARTFCQSEVTKDPSAIMYVLSGNRILETVMDLAYQRRKNKRSRTVYAIGSTAVVFAVALCFSLFVMPFSSPLAHGLFTCGITVLYIMALFACGTGNIEALVMMVILLVLLAIVVPTMKKHMKVKKVPVPASVPTSAGIR